MFSSVTNFAGRAPRFSSASWMPLASGAMLGAFIFGFVQMGIFYTGIDTDWFKLFMGAMMVTAVLFNSYVRNRAMRSR